MTNFRTLRPTFEKLFTCANVGQSAQKIGAGRKTVYEIDPCAFTKFYYVKKSMIKMLAGPALFSANQFYFILAGAAS